MESWGISTMPTKPRIPLRCIRATSLPLSVALATDIRHLDFRGAGGFCGCVAQLRIAVAALAPVTGDQAGQCMIRRALPQRGAQIRAPGGEQTGIEFAVGGKPGAAAGVAARPGGRGAPAA